jgi:hypothetical protein
MLKAAKAAETIERILQLKLSFRFPSSRRRALFAVIIPP